MCQKSLKCWLFLKNTFPQHPFGAWGAPLGALWAAWGALRGSKGGFQGPQATPNIDFNLIWKVLGRQKCRKMLPKCV